MPATNHRFLLRRRPPGDPVTEDFALVEEALPELGESQILTDFSVADGDKVTVFPNVLLRWVVNLPIRFKRAA